MPVLLVSRWGANPSRRMLRLPRITIRELASRVLLVALSSVICFGSAEALFRWYTGRTFDDKFPPWTGNLVVVRGAQVFAFKPHASGVFPGNVDMTRTFPYRTNAHGLRDRDRPAKAQGSKPANRPICQARSKL